MGLRIVAMSISVKRREPLARRRGSTHAAAGRFAKRAAPATFFVIYATSVTGLQILSIRAMACRL